MPWIPSKQGFQLANIFEGSTIHQLATGINRKRQINLWDPDGTRIEFMEPNTVDGVPTPSSTAPPPVVEKTPSPDQPAETETLKKKGGKKQSTDNPTKAL